MRSAKSAARGASSNRASLLASAALVSIVIVPSAVRAQSGKAVQLEEITVESQKPTYGTTGVVATVSTAGMKSNTSILDTPATVSVITRDELNLRGVQDLNLATAYTPNVQAIDYPGGQGAPTFTLRGFQAINFENVYEDGLRYGFNIFDQNIEQYAYERIDVVKGPLSALYGSGQPGGIVDLVSKRPSFTRVNELVVQGGSFNRIQGGFDLTGPVQSAPDFAYRFTGLVRNADTQVRFSPNDRIYFAPAITWRPSNETSLTVLAKIIQDRGGGSEQSLPIVGTIKPSSLGFIQRNLFVGQPNLNDTVVNDRSVGYIFDQNLAPNVLFHSAFRYLNTQSNYNATALSFPISESLLAETPYIRSQKSQAVLADNYLQGKFATGALRHNVTMGLDFQNYDRANKQFLGATDYILDIYNPVYPTAIQITPDQFFLYQRQQSRQFGMYGQDQVKFGGLILTGSVRNDLYESRVFTVTDFIPAQPKAVQSISNISYRGAAGYEFDIGATPYVAYATSFNPQPGGTTSTGQQLDPNKANQIEGGVKYQPRGVNAIFTASYFTINQTNIARPDPNFIGALVATGAAESKGLELEAKADLGSGLTAIAGFAHLETRVTKDTVLALGSRLPNAPNNSGSLFLAYAFPTSTFLAGLQAGAGVRYIGQRTDATNLDDLPAYTLVDASITYDLARLGWKGLLAQVTASNLGDVRYFNPAFRQGFVREGFRRNVLGTVTYRW